MQNRIIRNAVAGLSGIILAIGISTPAAALHIQSNIPVQIHQQPYVQSALVGYIYNNNIAELENKGRQGWVKIKSGDVIGWIDKSVLVQGEPDGYTVAKIHPDVLTVYADPDKNSTEYTTVYGDQEIECVEYKNDWLTLAFDDGSYGFIDAYQAELKTYYGTAESIEETPIVEQKIQKEQETYDLIYQSAPSYIEVDEEGEIYYNEDFPQQEYQNYNYNDYSQYELSPQEINYTYQDDPSYNEQEDNLEPKYNDYQQPITENYDNSDEQYNDNSEEQYNEDEQIYDDSLDQDIYEDDTIDEQVPYEDPIADQPSGANAPNYDVVGYADQYVGNPYQWGGNSLTDGIDCSHFVWQVLTNTGHYNGGYAVADDWSNLGTNVDSLDQAVAGDVIVYPGHVAIYDGEGSLIEAKGKNYGITHDRSVDYNNIVSIRHFD